MQRASQHTKQVDRGTKQGPMLVIHEFCNGYHLHEAKQMLWDWLVTAISKNHSLYDEAKERSSLVFFFEQLNALLDATYALHQQASPKQKTKKTTINKRLRPPAKP